MQPSEPEILVFQERCEAFYPADAVEAPIEQQRQWYDALCSEFSPPRPKGMETKDTLINGVSTRRYTPAVVRTDTLLIYFHGGGFVVGSLDSHDSICADIADGVGAELIATDYRLAPEHKWPAQSDDCYSALTSFVSIGRNVVLIGDSAGGNLAAGTAIRARDDGYGDHVKGQVLIYPALGGDLKSGSYFEMANAPGLTTTDVAYYREVLGADDNDPIAHPLKAKSLAGLPPACICSAHFDPLRDDARDYAERLRSAGIPVTYHDEPQMIHAWLRARHMSPGAKVAFDALCAGVNSLLR